MEIQNVTIEDAEELLDIYAPYVKYTAITFEYDVPSVEEFRQRIVNISDRYPYIKAVDNGQIVGYAYGKKGQHCAVCFCGRDIAIVCLDKYVRVALFKCKEGYSDCYASLWNKVHK